MFGNTSDDATDRMLVAKFETYWNLAVEDERVVGLKPYHFDSSIYRASAGPYANQYRVGADHFPTLLASMRKHGAALKAKAGPKTDDDGA